MSTIITKRIDTPHHRAYKILLERYESAQEVVETCKHRQRTSESFDDATQKGGAWEGVKDYAEALSLLSGGYQPTVESLRGVLKANKETARFTFHNSVAGFAPIVPLALLNVPTCMLDMRMTPIKAKVIDIYYDMTASSGTDSDEIIKAGQVMLSTIVGLEQQGYRFNIYACQSYSDKQDADVLTVKVKSASQPLDLKRVSFPLTHTGFFRVIGFDWYSKVPGGRYRSCYGHALRYEFRDKAEMDVIIKNLFGKTAIYFSAVDILNGGEEYIKKEVEANGNSKA